MPAKSLELKHTISLIRILTEEIDEIESSIQKIMHTLDAPILGTPGINYRMGAMIFAELGDLSRFFPRIKSLIMQECPPPLTNPDN